MPFLSDLGIMDYTESFKFNLNLKASHLGFIYSFLKNFVLGFDDKTKAELQSYNLLCEHLSLSICIYCSFILSSLVLYSSLTNT